MRIGRMIAGLACAASGYGCHHQAAKTPPLQGPVVGMTVVERVPMGPPSANDTTARGRMMREARERASAAARRVDTIIVSGGPVTVAVGETIPLAQFRAVARDRAGAIVDGFAPSFSLADNTIATLRGGQLTGLQPGTTTLRVAAVSFDSLPLRVVTRASIPVTVRPGTGAASREGAPARADSLPRELVEALIGGGRITPDRILESLPQGLFRDARVLGSREGPGGTATVAVFPWPRGAAVDTVRRRLEAAGFAPPPRPETPQASGFVSSGRAFGPINYLCRGDEWITFNATVGRDPARTTIAVSPGTGRGGPCSMSAGAPMGGNAARTLIPALEPPPGVDVLAAGSSAGMDEASSNGRVEGRMELATVLDHYAAQLKAARWTMVDRQVLPGVGVAWFDLTDTRGRSWFGSLLVMSPPNSSRGELRVAIQAAR